MKTPHLLGIITVLLFGSFAVSGMMAQGGVEDLEIITELGNLDIQSGPALLESIATCPVTHKLIGGGIARVDFGGDGFSQTLEFMNTPPNSFTAQKSLISTEAGALQSYANCAKINFPMMGMIGGELLDIDTMSLFIGAIGVNPVITGLVAITMGGVAAQAIWYVNSKRKSGNSLE